MVTVVAQAPQGLVQCMLEFVGGTPEGGILR